MPGYDSPGAAKRSYPPPKARGSSREELPHFQAAVAAGAQEGLENYSTFKVRRGSSEEIPLVQGKKQWLCFDGAVAKRNLTFKAREKQVRR